MENNPQTPSLESSMLNLEKELEEATVESVESFVIAEEEPKSEFQSLENIPENIDTAHEVMTQSRNSQVLIFKNKGNFDKNV